MGLEKENLNSPQALASKVNDFLKRKDYFKGVQPKFGKDFGGIINLH